MYISSHFSNLEEAQKTLSQNAFFLFDIHQVLFHRKGPTPFIKALTKVKNKKAVFLQGFRAFFSRKTWKKLRHHQREGNLITEVYLDAAADYPALHSELLNYSNNIYTIDNNMKQLLTNLKKKYNLYLLSNIGLATLSRLTAEYPDFFNLLSDPVNTINRQAPQTHQWAWKPRLNAYQEALSAVNQAHNPHLAIFIDDKERNVKAAHQAGMNAIRFTSYARFEKDLSKLLNR